ncbi:hypothetical protein TRAPUB_4755 [Trametes pubescens]|uniref:Uncharacterized protein n=1 Tax=Trametes pubescens TaxID=154538 RepID=A0A1M2VAC9_TRAPU|nr:hypothetical protein TRAPUB_4755 [Trametes pubescens]
MAFAQFYYDPALEFEKLLDEDTAAGGGSEAHGQVQAVAPIAAGGDAKVAKSTEHGAIVRSTSMTAAEPQPEQGDRWFGEGLLRRCASTGSIHGGTHPGVPK